MPLIRKPTGHKPAEQPSAQTSTHADALKALVVGNQEERWSAARAAVDVPGGADALAAALRSEIDPRIREAMFTSLVRIGSSDSIDALLRFLRSDDASLRTGALDAIRTLPHLVRDHLPALMNDDESDVRVLSCEVVRGLPGAEATQMLCDLLSRESEANVCAAAIDVLTEVGDAAALPALEQCEARFRDTPFLAFAIKVARDRILLQPTSRHV
jgi:HEAT repeat protein